MSDTEFATTPNELTPVAAHENADSAQNHFTGLDSQFAARSTIRSPGRAEALPSSLSTTIDPAVTIHTSS
ncbi:hypothetical protein [Nocardia carnea]|uniref:Uncharacterized protein n=1 Tax=Nocardia carnea TaxID=37328 RepID=A0ABW7TTW3_9NOCA|nr:hypothetical protein [Nocardia carnea]